MAKSYQAACLIASLAAATGAGCRAVDPAFMADIRPVPGKTSRVFAAPPSAVGPALLVALDDLAIRVDRFTARDDQQGNVLDLETTAEADRRPGVPFRNAEILSSQTRFGQGIAGPDLLDGEVHRADGRTLRFAGIEGIFSGQTADGRTIVVTTRRHAGGTTVNVGVGGLGDQALCRAVFEKVEAQLSGTPVVPTAQGR